MLGARLVAQTSPLTRKGRRQRARAVRRGQIRQSRELVHATHVSGSAAEAADRVRIFVIEDVAIDPLLPAVEHDLTHPAVALFEFSVSDELRKAEAFVKGPCVPIPGRVAASQEGLGHRQDIRP